MTPGIAVRRGESRDRAFALDLGKRTVMDSDSPLRPGIPSLVELSYERLVEFVEAQSHVLLIAHDALNDLGFLLLLDLMPDEVSMNPQAFIAYMAVEPQARRRGIARALLHEAEGIARERGLPAIAMMVTETNVPAVGLYEASGYRTERRLLCKPL